MLSGYEDLVIALIVHEMVFVPLVIQVLHFSLFQGGLFEFVIRAIGLGKLVAIYHVTQLASIQRLAFAGFGKLEIGYDIRITVYLYFQTFS
jgi:hypothetical protein